MKEAKKVKILTKAQGKYQSYNLEELEQEAKIIAAQILDVQNSQAKFENNILTKWEETNMGSFLDNKNIIKKALIAGISGGLAGTGIIAFWALGVGVDQMAQFITTPVSFMGGLAIGIGNASANIHKPVSLPIARAYDRFLGDKIEVLGKKKLMVDELIDAQNKQNEYNYENNEQLKLFDDNEIVCQPNNEEENVK